MTDADVVSTMNRILADAADAPAPVNIPHRLLREVRPFCMFQVTVSFEFLFLAVKFRATRFGIILSSRNAFNVSALTLQHRSGPRTLRPASAEEDSATSFSALCHPRPTPPTATVWALPSRN